MQINSKSSAYHVSKLSLNTKFSSKIFKLLEQMTNHEYHVHFPSLNKLCSPEMLNLLREMIKRLQCRGGHAAGCLKEIDTLTSVSQKHGLKIR